MSSTSLRRPKGWTQERAALLFSSGVFPVPQGCYEIDPETWHSIGGQELYQAVDRSCSFAGSQALYQSLRRPSLNQNHIDQLERCISLFKDHPRARGSLERTLGRLDQAHAWHTHELLLDGPPALPLSHWQITVLGLLAPLSLGLALLFGSWIWAGALVCFAANTLLHFKVSLATSTRMDALFSLRRVVRACTELSKDSILSKALEGCELEESLKPTKKLAKGGLLVDLTDPTGFLDYLKICTLYDARFYASRFQMIRRNVDAFRRLFYIVGFADRCISVLRLREELGHQVSIPKLGSHEPFELQNCVHPLLNPQRAVANSISLQAPGAILTGLNMGGKSTFLRSVAVNAVLSQTINTAFCTLYTAPFFRVYSVSCSNDNLSQGKSHYLQELLSIHSLVRASTSSEPCLFVVDEMFTGTNSDERIAASAAVLDELGRRNIVLAASHDLEVLSLVSPAFEFFNFSGLIEEQRELRFDYRLRKGQCQQRNALRLMRQIGYPAHVVRRAESICEHAISSGPSS